MISAIKQFFDNHLAPGAAQVDADPQQAVRLAVAALLVEVAEADYQQHPEERQALLNAIRNRFSLDAKEAESLIQLAESEHANATDYFQFTRLINSGFSAEQKNDLIEALWEVAFSDQQLHHYEEHVIRRLSELLHVPHKEFIAAKHRVMDRD